MSGLPVEATEPDPAATSISNDQTVTEVKGVQSTSDEPTIGKASEEGSSTKPTSDVVAKEIESAAEVNQTAESEGTGSEVNGKNSETTTGTEVTDTIESEAADFEKKVTHDKEKEKKPDNSRNNGKRRRHETNNKFDPSVMPQTDDPDQIRAQAEFYFGDANLPVDAFLWELTSGPRNVAVPVKTIHSFKRMRRFQPYSAVIAALKDSKILVIAGEEGAEKVSRKHPFKPTPSDAREARSVYAKGFGDEEPTTQFDLEAFFSSFGPYNAVRLRRTKDGKSKFKGSVFVEFSEEATAKNFLELDPKPKYRGNELITMTKKAYCDEKVEAIQRGEVEPNESRPKRGGGVFNGGNRGSGDWNKRRDNDRKSGFNKDRNGRGGRGGRGRRGRGRGDRDHQKGRRDENTSGERDNGIPTVKPTDASGNVVDNAPASKKRERDDNGGDNEQPAKKVDTKADAVAVDA